MSFAGTQAMNAAQFLAFLNGGCTVMAQAAMWRALADEDEATIREAMDTSQVGQVVMIANQIDPEPSENVLGMACVRNIPSNELLPIGAVCEFIADEIESGWACSPLWFRNEPARG